MRRVLVDGRAAARATGVRALATTDETRATAAKRELAVLAEAFQRYDGRAQRPWTLNCCAFELRHDASRATGQARTPAPGPSPRRSESI